MAWIDDRIWCHPKIVSLSPQAFRAYVNGIAYSSGMGTRGHLDESQQRLVGARKPIRNELISAQLWNENGDAGVYINSWEEHNGKRDARRAADRIRKREMRKASAGQGADSPQDAPQDTLRTSRGQTRGPAHVDGSEGSDGKPPPIPEPHSKHAGREGQAGDLQRLNPVDDIDFPAA